MTSILLALIGFTGVRDGDVEAPIAWAARSVAVTIQQDGSDDVANNSDILAVEAAMAVWTNVPCSDFELTLAGMTASRNDAADGINLVTFREASWPGGADGAVAFTTRYRDTGGAVDTWTEADVLLNGFQFSWSTSGDVQRFDVQSVVTHELGHALGLQHSSLPEATMYFGTRSGVTYARTLHPDDVAGLCYLYPTAAFSCASDSDCPLLSGLYGGADLRYRCAGTVCVLGSSSIYGAECGVAGDCSSGQCTTDPERTAGGDPDFCSLGCSTPADCAGDLCAASVCYVGREDCLNDDDCPGVNNVCVFDLDGRFRCRTLCLEDRHCAGALEVCHGGTGANPPGFCRLPGPSGQGTACESGLECDSLACTGGGAAPACLGGPLVRMDGGTGNDASLPDAVVTPDAGETDAMIAEADGGSPDGSIGLGDAEAGDGEPRDATDGGILIVSEVTGGCGCSTAGSSDPWLFISLVLAWLPRTRHRVRPCSKSRSLVPDESVRSMQTTWRGPGRG